MNFNIFVNNYLSIYLESKLFKEVLKQLITHYVFKGYSSKTFLKVFKSFVTTSRGLTFLHAEKYISHNRTEAYLRDGTVVPDIPFIREQIGHVTELSFFHILFNWV